MQKNKLWIPILAGVLAVALLAGALIIPRLPKAEAAVFPVTMVGYTDYYSGSAESYGMVTTDKVQTHYVSGTQTITEILVYAGQRVEKGDVLFTYDTTLSDLAIERKDLENQQLEVKLKTAKAELTELKGMKAIVYKPGSTSTKTDYTQSPSDTALLDKVYSTKTSGTTKSNPLYVWLRNATKVDDGMIEYLFGEANGNPDTIYVVFQTTSGDKANTEFSVHTGVSFTKVYEPAPTVPAEPTEPTEPSQPTEPSETTEPTEPAETTQPTEPSQPADSAEGASSSQTESTAEMILTGYSMTFFEPPSTPKEDTDTVEWNSGYTSAELAAMKTEKQAEIKQLEFDIKMGKAELKIMQKEAQDGKVVAEFSGVVSQILDPAVAMETGEPFLKVTGGGGYYVEGSVSELALDTIELGQRVTVNSWETGAVCTGEVVEIGDYPVENESYYGSANVTYYPYRVFIDESADLQEDSYVSMSYQTAEQAAGILYLQNAFLRTEGNQTYVFVRNDEGLLEKRYLECGVSSDGYMTPVYSGITEEDYLAFPYDKTVTEGAPTYEGTDQDLYGY